MGKILRIKPDSAYAAVILSSGVDGCQDAAMDITNGKIYWTNDANQEIKRCDLDGGNNEVWLDTSTAGPGGITVDPAGGKVYWYQDNPHKLRSANLDGTGATDILVSGIAWIGMMAVHPAEGKLVLCELTGSQIFTCDLDGSNLTAIVTGITATPDGPSATVDVINDKIYYTDGDELRVCDMDGGNDALVYNLDTGGTNIIRVEYDRDDEYLYFTYSYEVGDIYRVHTNGTGYEAVRIAAQDSLINGWKAILYKPSTSVYFQTIISDIGVAQFLQRVREIDADQSLVVTDAVSFEHLNSIGDHIYTRYLASDLGLVQDVVTWIAPHASERLFVMDWIGDDCTRMDFDGNNRRSMFDTGSKPTDADIHVNRYELYWVDVNDNTISRANLDGTGIVTILTGGTTYTAMLSMCVDSYNNYIYFTDESGTNNAVYRMDLDGSNITKILEATVDNIVRPYGMATYNNQLYICDFDDDTVKRCDYDGSNLIDLITGWTSPKAICIDHNNERLFFSRGISEGDIYIADIDGTGDTLLTDANNPNDMCYNQSDATLYWTAGRDVKKTVVSTGVTSTIHHALVNTEYYGIDYFPLRTFIPRAMTSILTLTSSVEGETFITALGESTLSLTQSAAAGFIISPAATTTSTLTDQALYVGVFTRSLTTILSVGDSVDVGLALLPAFTHTISIASDVTTTHVRSQSDSDTLVITHLVSPTWTLQLANTSLVSVTDTASQLQTGTRVSTSTAVITDEVNALIAVTGNGTDTLVVSDIATEISVFLRDQSQALSLSDSLDTEYILQQAGLNTISITDTLQYTAVLIRSVSNTLVSSDVASVLRDVLRDATTTMLVTDSAAQLTVWDRSPTTTLSLTSIGDRLAIITYATSNSVSITDVNSYQTVLPRSVTHLVSMTDSVDVGFVLNKTTAGALVCTDATSRIATLGKSPVSNLSLAHMLDTTWVLPLSTDSTLTVTSVAAQDSVWPRTASSTLILADALNLAATLSLSLSSTLAPTDAAAFIAIRARDPAHTLVLTDATAQTPVYLRHTNNTLVIDHTVDRVAFVSPAATSDISLVDTASEISILNLSAADTLVVTQDMVGLIVLSISAASTLVLADVGAEQTDFLQSIAHTLSFASSGDRLVVSQQSLSSTVVVTGAAIQDTVSPRSLSDSLTVTQGLDAGLILVKPVSSDLTVTDAAGRIAVLQKVTSSTLVLSDVVTRLIVSGQSTESTAVLTSSVVQDTVRPLAASSAISLGSTVYIASTLQKDIASTFTLTSTTSQNRVAARTAADTFVATQSGSVIMVYARSLSSIASITDTFDPNIVLNKALSSTLVISDTLIRIATTQQITASTLAITSAGTGIKFVDLSLSTSMSLTDDLGLGFTLSKTLITELVVSDTATELLASIESGSNTLVATDLATQLGVWTRSLSESLVTTQTIGLGYTLKRDPTASLILSDGVSHLIEMQRGGVASLSVTHVGAFQTVRPRVAAGSLVLSQQATETSVLNYLLTNTIAFSISADQTSIRPRSGTNTLVLTTQSSAAMALPRAGTSVIALTDDLNFGYSLHFYADSTMPMTDSLGLAVSLNKPGLSTMTLTVGAAFAQSIFGRFPANTATLSSTSEYTAVYHIAGADNMVLLHALNVGYSLARQATDTLVATGTATRSFVAVRSSSSTLAMTSLASETSILGLAATSSVSPTDATEAATVYQRALSHTAALTDAVALVSVQNKTLADTLSLTDLATFNQTITRAGENTLTWQNRAWNSLLSNPASTLALTASAVFSLVPVVFQKVYVFDSTNNKIFRMDLDGDNVEDVWTSGITDGWDARLDLSSEKIYFIENGEGGIDRANIDGTSTVDNILTGISDPQGLAVGPDKVYWSDAGNGVWMSDLDGSNVSQIFTSLALDGAGPPDTKRGLAVDEENNVLYITSEGTNTIQKCDLDGSNLATVASSLGTIPRLVVDFINDYLYYFDSSDDKIYRITTSGTGNTEILSVGETVYDLTYNPINNKLYYSTDNDVYAMDADGNNVTAIYTDGLANGILGLDVHWRVQVWFRHASDTLIMTHDLELNRVTVESAANTLAMADAASVLAVRMRSLGDSLALTYSGVEISILNLNAISAVAATQGNEFLGVWGRSASSTVTPVDSSSQNTVWVRASTDVLTATDALDLKGVYGNTLTSTLVLAVVAIETEVRPVSAENVMSLTHSNDLGYSLLRAGISTVVPTHVSSFDAIFDRYATNTLTSVDTSDKNFVLNLSASNTLVLASDGDRNVVLGLATETALAVNHIGDNRQRYWVRESGATGTWHQTVSGDTWAYYSGGPSIAPIPTVDDDVHFDANGSVKCVANGHAFCRSMHLHADFDGLLDLSDSKDFYIGDSAMQLGLLMEGGTIQMGTNGDWHIWGDFDVTGGTLAHETAELHMRSTGNIDMLTSQYLYALRVYPGAEVTIIGGGHSCQVDGGPMRIDGTVHLDGVLQSRNTTVVSITAGSVVDGASYMHWLNSSDGGGIAVLDGTVSCVLGFGIREPMATAVWVPGTYPVCTLVTGLSSERTFKLSVGTYTFTGYVKMQCGSTGDLVWDNSNNPDVNFQGDFIPTSGTGENVWTKGTGTVGITGTATQALDFDGFSMEEIVSTKTGSNVATISGTFTTEYLTLTTGYWGFGDAVITITGDFTADNPNIHWGTGNIIIGGNADWRGITSGTTGTSQLKLTGTGKTFIADPNVAVYSMWVTGSYTIIDVQTLIQGGDLIIDGTLTVAASATYLICNGTTQIKINTGGTLTGTGGCICADSTGGGGLTVLDGTLSVANFYVRDATSTGVFKGGTWDSNAWFYANTGNPDIRLNNELYTITGFMRVQARPGGTCHLNNAINNPSFNVAGDLYCNTNNGTITWSKGTGTITLSGGSTQTCTMDTVATQTIEDITITSSSMLDMASDLKTDSLNVQAGTLDLNGNTLTTVGNFTVGTGGSFTVAGLNGCTINVGGQLTLIGQSGAKLDLGAAATWYLNVTSPTMSVQHVTVQNSDASGGETIHCTNSINEGSNVNWAFDGLYWTNGAANGLVNDYRNWGSESGTVDNAGVPGLLDTPIWDDGVTDDCSLDFAWSVAGVDMQSGYTGTIDGVTYNFTASGNAAFDGGEVDFGTGTWQFGGDADFADVTTITKGTATIKMVGTGKTLTLQATDTFPDIWIAGNTTIGATGYCEALDVDATLTIPTSLVITTRAAIDVSGTVTGAGTLKVYIGSPGEGIVGMSGMIDLTSLLVYVNTTTTGITAMVAAQYDSPIVKLGSDIAGGEFNFAGGTTTFVGDVSFDPYHVTDTVHFNNSTNNPSLVFQGNVSKTGSGSTSWTPGSGSVSFTGTLAQSINFDGNTIEDVSMNKSAERVTLGADLGCENLTLNDGEWDANDYDITVASNVIASNDRIEMGFGSTWEVGGSWDTSDVTTLIRQSGIVKMTGSGGTFSNTGGVNHAIWSLWIAVGASISVGDSTSGIRYGPLVIDGTLTIGAGLDLQIYYESQLQLNSTGLLTGDGQLWIRYCRTGGGINTLDGIMDINSVRIEDTLTSAVFVGGIYTCNTLIFSTRYADTYVNWSDDTYVFDCAGGVTLQASGGYSLYFDNTNGARILLPAGGFNITENGGGTVDWTEE